MGIFKIMKKGICLSNKKFKVVIYLWLINFLFSLMMVLPFYFLLKNHISRSLIGDRLLAGLDYLWLGDAFYKFQDTASIMPAMLFIPALLYLLLFIFLNGGIVGRLKDNIDNKVTLADFFKDCGAYFARFFRLFLLSIPGYLLLLGLPFGILSSLLGIFTDNAATEWPRIITSNLRFIIFILLFSMVNMLFDYVKIRLVMTDSRKVIKETWYTFKFLLKRLFKAWGLYLMVGLLFVVCTIIYLEISNLLPSHTMFLIILVFIWQQIYMIGRMWIKLNFFATQMELYKGVS